MAGGYDNGNDTHPSRCSCGYQRKPADRFEKVAGRWMCKKCSMKMRKATR